MIFSTSAHGPRPLHRFAVPLPRFAEEERYQMGGRSCRLPQADQDSRAAAAMDGAGGRDAPTHGLDEALGDGEAKTRALAVAAIAVGRLLQAAELLEDALDVGPGNAGPLVLDGDDHIGAVLIDGDLDGQA